MSANASGLGRWVYVLSRAWLAVVEVEEGSETLHPTQLVSRHGQRRLGRTRRNSTHRTDTPILSCARSPLRH